MVLMLFSLTNQYLSSLMPRNNETFAEALSKFQKHKNLNYGKCPLNCTHVVQFLE